MGDCQTVPRGRATLVVALAVVLAILAADTVAAKSSRRGGFVGGDLHSLVVNPADPARLFVGGHAAVATSSSTGRSWRPVRSLANADAMGWGFVGDTIWVSGHPGLNRSDDGGRTFQRVNAGLPNTDVHAFGAPILPSSASPATRPFVLYGASPAVGVFASTDGGESWEVRTDQVGFSFFGRIVVDPADFAHVLAADAANGPVESRDGGRTWRRLGGLRSAVWISASTDVSRLIASGPAGTVQSADGGATWTRLRTPRRSLLVELQPDAPDILYAAANIDGRARVWTSLDAGLTWTITSNSRHQAGALPRVLVTSVDSDGGGSKL